MKGRGNRLDSLEQDRIVPFDGACCPFDDELDRLRRKYRPPFPYYPLNRTHAPSVRFLRETGIYSLFFPDQSTHYALKILHNHPVRKLVEERLCARARPEVVVAGLSNRHQFACSADGVRKYQYFFFSNECTATIFSSRSTIC